MQDYPADILHDWFCIEQLFQLGEAFHKDAPSKLTDADKERCCSLTLQPSIPGLRILPSNISRANFCSLRLWYIWIEYGELNLALHLLNSQLSAIHYWVVD